MAPDLLAANVAHLEHILHHPLLRHAPHVVMERTHLVPVLRDAAIAIRVTLPLMA